MKLHIFSRFKLVIAICLIAMVTVMPVFAAMNATINSITRDECVIHINVTVVDAGTYYVQIWDDKALIDVQPFTASDDETLTVDYVIKHKAQPGAPGIGIYITDGPDEFATTFDGDDNFIYPDDVASNCAEQYAGGGECLIDIPAGSVVGDLPFDTQAYWAPGKVSPGVVLKAGTYWVVGEEADDAGSQFYKVVLACQYLYISADAMQPSFSGPWNGEALPSNAG